jgi:hypothetical protein
MPRKDPTSEVATTHNGTRRLARLGRRWGLRPAHRRTYLPGRQGSSTTPPHLLVMQLLVLLVVRSFRKQDVKNE